MRNRSLSFLLIVLALLASNCAFSETSEDRNAGIDAIIRGIEGLDDCPRRTPRDAPKEYPYPFAKDLVGAWKTNDWILLVNERRQALMVCLAQAGAAKVAADGKVEISIIPKNPDADPSTEPLGVLQKGKWLCKGAFGGGAGVLHKVAAPPKPAKPNSSPKDFAQGWVQQLHASVLAIFQAKPNARIEEDPTLSGVWQMQPTKEFPEVEEYILVDTKGYLLRILIRDRGQLTVDDRGNIASIEAGLTPITANEFGFYRVGTIVKSHDDYSTTWEKCIVPRCPW
jgi:hypothetical protein